MSGIDPAEVAQAAAKAAKQQADKDASDQQAADDLRRQLAEQEN